MKSIKFMTKLSENNEKRVYSFVCLPYFFSCNHKILSSMVSLNLEFKSLKIFYCMFFQLEFDTYTLFNLFFFRLNNILNSN